MATSMRYALITPAHNEEATIEQTFQSMIAQTVLPAAWVVVSDGSTDRTDEIASRYASEYPWIMYVRLPEHRDRQFAAKVGAFNEGYRLLDGIQYDIIGNLDADITFSSASRFCSSNSVCIPSTVEMRSATSSAFDPR